MILLHKIFVNLNQSDEQESNVCEVRTNHKSHMYKHGKYFCGFNLNLDILELAASFFCLFVPQFDFNIYQKAILISIPVKTMMEAIFHRPLHIFILNLSIL